MTGTGRRTLAPRHSDGLLAEDLDLMVDELCRLLPAWLPGQRWYAGKGHGVLEVRPVLAEVVVPGPPTLVQAVFRTGDGECYQLLVGAVPGPADARTGVSAAAVIGSVPLSDGRRTTLYEASVDPGLLSGLLDRFVAAEPCGVLEYHHVPGAVIPAGLRARPLTGEQSNTSVVFGDRMMLKVLRRIMPGANTELEMLAALERAGDVPSAAPLAWAQSAGRHGAEPAVLGILQEFVPSRGDGWTIATAEAEACIRGECASVAPVGGFPDDAFALGQATARVHMALAQQLETRTLSLAQVVELTDALVARLDDALVEVPDLIPYARGLHTAYQDLREVVRRGNPLPVQRIHGDLHLGQVLRAADGWVLIDFEGEPGHPFEERRRPQPTVRDVAAMLRSFDYAAHHALGEILGVPPGKQATGDPRGTRLARRASAWAVHSRRAFCAGYTRAGGQDPRTSPVLLRAFEADKAVYEALYEARNRPEWLPIPLAAVRRLAHGSRFVG
ncbi:phosphotransferase [Streptomyces sp. NBC_01500]|uniref:maltokinase N-terminal cap-like domain-containing protein n=1 Tax=Streptomyces sp. NBC_01500 TaxID=2903886 RepID=UPI00224D14E0|nr:phosphotransferase [Streptomyces sp. NBC_01500]MCX4554507.1 phosphotransferase [Streptomyces sp. NBC_01500]